MSQSPVTVFIPSLLKIGQLAQTFLVSHTSVYTCTHPGSGVCQPRGTVHSDSWGRVVGVWIWPLTFL